MPKRLTKRLTKRTVDALRAKAAKAGRDVYAWDGEVKGFGIRARPSGSSPYLLKYSRGARGTSRKVTIGPHGSPWTVETARDEAKRLIGAIKDGKDPAAERAAARERLTLEGVAVQYILEHARVHKAESSAELDRLLLARGGIAAVPKPQAKAAETRRGHELEDAARIALEPIARVRVDLIERSDIAALHHKRRHTPVDANRLLAVLRRIFTLAEMWGYRPEGSNPCRGIPRYREQSRTRFLSDAELARLGKALAQAEADWTAERNRPELKHVPRRKGSEAPPLVDPFAIAAIRLLLFTGARRSEVLKAKWADVDFEAAVLHVAQPKEGKPKAIRLGPPALAVLKGLPRLEGNPHVIVGRRAGAHLTDLEHPWQRVRKVAGLDDVRLHDLRHSHASVAAASGESLLTIGALLGHRTPATTARYAHLSTDRLGAVAKTTSERIASAMGVGEREAEQEAGGQAKPAGELVPMPKIQMRKTRAGGR